MIKTNNNIAPFKLDIFCCTNKRPAGHSVGSCGEKCSEDLYLYLKARCRELGLTLAFNELITLISIDNIEAEGNQISKFYTFEGVGQNTHKALTSRGQSLPQCIA